MVMRTLERRMKYEAGYPGGEIQWCESSQITCA